MSVCIKIFCKKVGEGHLLNGKHSNEFNLLPTQTSAVRHTHGKSNETDRPIPFILFLGRGSNDHANRLLQHGGRAPAPSIRGALPGLAGAVPRAGGGRQPRGDNRLRASTSTRRAVDGRSGGDRSAASSRRPPPPSIFESLFDLTPERLRHVFARFDTDADGRISYDSLRRGLDFAAGRSFSEDEELFQILIEHLDLDRSGDISFPEFSEGLGLLLLRDLFQRKRQREDHDDAVVEVMDYDTVHMERHTVNGSNSPRESTTGSRFGQVLEARDFYFQQRPEWVQNRWINVRGANGALTMQTMAVKYALHPLALEDALSPESHRPKAESYTNHYFVMCPYFSIASEPVEQQEAVASRPGKCAHAVLNSISWCLRGFPKRRSKNRSIRASIRQESDEEESEGDASDPLEEPGNTQIASIEARMASIFVTTPANDTTITYIHGDSGDSHLWRRVQDNLGKSYSKLRQYDAQYLVYALLDEAVDAIDPIVASIRSEVEEEWELLRETRFESLDRIHHLKLQVNKVIQKLKPFMRLLEHVIEDDAICPGATIYLRDVLDNLEGCEEEVRQLLLTCEAVDVEADKFHSRQMDRTL